MPPVFGLPTFPELADIWWGVLSGNTSLYTWAPPVGAADQLNVPCQLYVKKNAPAINPVWGSPSVFVPIIGGTLEMWIPIASWNANVVPANLQNINTAAYSVVKMSNADYDAYFVPHSELRRHQGQPNEYHVYYLKPYLRIP